MSQPCDAGLAPAFSFPAPRASMQRLISLSLVLLLHGAILWALWQHRLIPGPQEAMTLFVAAAMRAVYPSITSVGIIKNPGPTPRKPANTPIAALAMPPFTRVVSAMRDARESSIFGGNAIRYARKISTPT